MTQDGPGPLSRPGQAVYSPLVLKLYDFWVLGLSNTLVWRCPTRDLRALYDRNISGHHLDLGVGTGYFLHYAQFPVAQPIITLADLNAHSLAAAARRIRRYRPVTMVADALQPLPLPRTFHSASLNYLLHCLPGPMAHKCAVFDHVVRVVVPGGRIFGATIVQGAAPRNWAAQALMDLYNAKGIFSNRHDAIADLESELRSRFDAVVVSRQGCVALFEGRVRA